jgi:hypothetical protein
MAIRRVMPGPCVLCGHRKGRREAGAWRCAVCDWRVGDVPDPGLPRPRIEVVYYLRYAERIKIGTSHDPHGRLRAIMHDELLAFERGGRALEQARHRQFAAIREGGEWFTATDDLVAHARGIRGTVDPWHAYARWVSEALQPQT